MRVLVSGHNGYVGAVMVPFLLNAGHEVVGLDSYLFEECVFEPCSFDIPTLRLDLRDVRARHLEGFEAVIHLAALSNDPLGDLHPELTYDINHRASVRLAEAARDAGASRYLFSSSCSLYGAAAGDGFLAEGATFNPVTPYGESKVRVESEVSKLATESFSPVFLRNATAYGPSPQLRVDLMVNNLVGYAFTTGQVLIKSDGTPWRPLVHVEDMARAFLAALEAPRELVHNQAFNVGRTEENFQVRDVAAMVEEVVPNSHVEFAPGASPDVRNYRVDFTKINTNLPGFRPTWSVRDGVEQLYEAYKRHGLTADEFLGGRYIRIKHIQCLQARGALDPSLRWRTDLAHQRAGLTAPAPGS